MDDPSPHTPESEEPRARTRRVTATPRAEDESKSLADDARIRAPHATPRLDLRAAARLADDARNRMRESQDQLARAQEQIGALTERRSAPDPKKGWTRHALASDSVQSDTAGRAVTATPEDATEIIELRAALDIAHETAQAQREERESLFAENESLRTESKALAEALERAGAEHAQTIARASELETERDELLCRVQFESAAAAELRTQIESAETRLGQAETLLERLRETLSTEQADRAEAERPYSGFRLHSDVDDVDLASPCPEAEIEILPCPEPRRSGSAPADETQSANPMLAPIYDPWLDDQVRRHFGAMGLDDLADLVAAPIRRNPVDDNKPTRIVLMGDHCPQIAAPLADSLLEKTESAIEVFALDTDRSRRGGALGLASDHPLGDSVHVVSTPNDPDSLARTLQEIDPNVLVARSFFSRQTRIEDWLPILSELHDNDCDLIFIERAGRAPGPPPREMTEIGDRIWDLMPERYKATDEGKAHFASWAEAFAATASGNPNETLDRLRETYQFELFAQFGYLSEPFIGSSIGKNFSVDAASDRRFLRQIADLDDRRVEAGTVRGLHWLAWIARRE